MAVLEKSLGFHAKQEHVACRPDHVQVVVLNGTPLFFAQRDGPWFPTLRLLHQYPSVMARLRVDKGAIKFVLAGANIMCPGLTSPGATIHDEVSWQLSASGVGIWDSHCFYAHDLCLQPSGSANAMMKPQQNGSYATVGRSHPS